LKSGPPGTRHRSVESWPEIRRLSRSEGMSGRAIARRLGVARDTVAAALASFDPPRYRQAGSGSAVDGYEPATVAFPKHLTDAVVEFIVVGDGYFDFRGGRPGLIKEAKRFVTDDHWLVTVLKATDNTRLEKLISLRNWAAHESPQSKKRAKAAIGMNAGSAGSWAMRQCRLRDLISEIEKLARAVIDAAPY